jgi:hypothetical protein
MARGLCLWVAAAATFRRVDAEDVRLEIEQMEGAAPLVETDANQWRIVGAKGMTQNGTRIDRIRGRWVIAEVQFFTDSVADQNAPGGYKCSGRIYSDNRKTHPLTPIDTSCGDNGPWFPEIRAVDMDEDTQFWSTCYQTKGCRAWYGIKIQNAQTVKCIKIKQKDADAYVATTVRLERWYSQPNGERKWCCKTDEARLDKVTPHRTEVYERPDDELKSNQDDVVWKGYWKVVQKWTLADGKDNPGGRWLKLVVGHEKAMDGGAHRRAAAHGLLLVAAAASTWTL